MLDFEACEFLEVCYKFGVILGEAKKLSSSNPDLMGESLTELLVNTQKLGLRVTFAHLISLMAEIVPPGQGERQVKEMQFRGSLSGDRAIYHMETLYSTLIAELDSLLFKAIPRERIKYSSSEWLKDTLIDDNFPTSFKELERAGMCYSLGQSTACVFHSMRALEPGLSALAQPFGVSSSHDNWQTVISDIESKIRAIGQQPKTQQKIEDEKFYGGAVSHLYFVKNAWRNHVAHTRDSYSDNEALKVMQQSKEFIESLCPRLKE